MRHDVRLHLGDCVEAMGPMDSESIDLILTSPPYDKLRAYASGSAFDFEALALECKRVLKPGGVLVWVVGDQTKDGDESGTSFRQALHFKSIGLNLHDTMIYRKANPLTIKARRYQPEFEFMFVFSLGDAATFNPIMDPCKKAGRIENGRTHFRNGTILSQLNGSGKPYNDRKVRGNVWTYSVGANRHMRRTGHPAVFPLQLAVDHVLSWTNEGDTVCDPFMGSGTTGEACLKTGRKFVGVEKAPEYFAIAEKRIADARAERDSCLPFGALALQSDIPLAGEQVHIAGLKM